MQAGAPWRSPARNPPTLPPQRKSGTRAKDTPFLCLSVLTKQTVIKKPPQNSVQHAQIPFPLRSAKQRTQINLDTLRHQEGEKKKERLCIYLENQFSALANSKTTMAESAEAKAILLLPRVKRKRISFYKRMNNCITLLLHISRRVQPTTLLFAAEKKPERLQRFLPQPQHFLLFRISVTFLL